MSREFDRKEKEGAKYLLEQELNRAMKEEIAELKKENKALKEKIEKLEEKVKSLRLKYKTVKSLK